MLPNIHIQNIHSTVLLPDSKFE